MQQPLPDLPSNAVEEPTLGDIRINHNVVASIVRLAALQVTGVAAVGGSFVDGLTEMFTKRENDHRGVRVNEDSSDNYDIEVRLVVLYGAEIARTAYEVQLAVRKQVIAMTGKNVARVDVVIEGVRLPGDATTGTDRAEDLWPDAPATD